ncbi:ubiquitin-like protein 4A [Diorhabda carinulata]|uniref:ubiquitin-like protein 4A n=1 Tax=Diorhabda sublineata TaxID=1163346 RepID=UPI0024E139F4|nr:ubiquitin-like protein 4A [Diorhabda sublineata]XP_057651940.1 ubiquitin-like protein 4A [Diorhabda carinulata]
MKILVKCLQGGSTLLDVSESSTVSELKKLVQKNMRIPVFQQTLILFGKCLQDEKCISDYPQIKDGTKLYVAIKNPDFFNTTLHKFLRKYYHEAQCKVIVEEFMKNFHSKVNSLSLDDLERIAKSEIESAASGL